jgi:hypothetical protein
MERVTVVRRLLQAASFLRNLPGTGGQIPPFSAVFTVRAYDHDQNVTNSQLRWQAGVGQNPKKPVKRSHFIR